ncbi:hypothetical protein EJ110_NYTH23382 [Nymphaea thermarum]|nr:hypothetical protein EJ110_NYTH23382 [Nymphaea thermarum]
MIVLEFKFNACNFLIMHVKTFSIFQDPLKPCCRGVSSASNCGSMDEQGDRLYQVCSSPWYTFFWDSVHPTQAGWSVVIPSLRPTLDQLLSSL